ncbi:hypothetical protein [Reinekea sp.]|uniref:hypothetical protein n=1 Tax=Reinekea sp. TaxID=1970455 RepID=UPI002A83F7EE|nr:hypothetical protein [Reinekea sp.]
MRSASPRPFHPAARRTAHVKACTLAQLTRPERVNERSAPAQSAQPLQPLDIAVRDSLSPVRAALPFGLVSGLAEQG